MMVKGLARPPSFWLREMPRVNLYRQEGEEEEEIVS